MEFQGEHKSAREQCTRSMPLLEIINQDAQERSYGDLPQEKQL